MRREKQLELTDHQLCSKSRNHNLFPHETSVESGYAKITACVTQGGKIRAGHKHASFSCQNDCHDK